MVLLTLVWGTATRGQDSQRKDINSATEKDLTQVPGIGPKTAQRILEYRAELGSFRSMKQLTDVPRIGKKTLDKMICVFFVPEEGPLPCAGPTGSPAVGSAARVNLNTDPVQTLMTLPGVGKKRAAMIVASRKEDGWFRTIQDLTRIKGIGAKTVSKLADHLEVRLNINRGRAAQFEALGFPDGDAIVQYRTTHGPFLSVDDLGKVPGLDRKVLDSVLFLLTSEPVGEPASLVQ